MRLLFHRLDVLIRARRGALRVAVAALGLIATGCVKDEAPETTSAARAATRVDDSSAGVIDVGGERYRPTTVTSSGGVAGRVTFDEPAVVDSSPAAATSQGPCVDPSSGAGGAASTNRAADAAVAVVWIADARTGKAIPIEKRHELGATNCALAPTIQPTVTSSTFNIFNDDRDIHRLVFVRLGTNDTLAKMPFFNDGQVVASERLATKPGLIEVRCVHHTWMRAYVAVFSHPYYAVTGADGSFKIDSLPPGKYHLRVWRPGLAAPVEREVRIAGGVTGQLGDWAVGRAAP